MAKKKPLNISVFVTSYTLSRLNLTIHENAVQYLIITDEKVTGETSETFLLIQAQEVAAFYLFYFNIIEYIYVKYNATKHVQVTNVHMKTANSAM